MGFMDSVRGIVNKGKDFASRNPDKVENFIDKTGDQVDKRTGGKYAQHVDKAQDAARKHLGDPGNPAPGTRPGPGGQSGPEGGPGPEAQPGPQQP
ncbi:antitoxin [Rhodococcus sp. NPDC047139]|uniref:antitoxin n=1 Tax=Rhodococcus sp. NPDC047139 TaxID=3155141 RepID=UPI0033D07D57